MELQPLHNIQFCNRVLIYELSHRRTSAPNSFANGYAAHEKIAVAKAEAMEPKTKNDK